MVLANFTAKNSLCRHLDLKAAKDEANLLSFSHDRRCPWSMCTGRPCPEYGRRR